MGFLSGKKEGNLDIEDSVKILSTNLEVINQRLASLGSDSSYGGGNDSGVVNHINELSKKIDFLTNIVTSSNNKIHQELSFLNSGIDTSIQSVQTIEKSIVEQLSYRNDMLRKEFVNITQESIHANKSQSEMMFASVKENNEMIENLKDTFQNLAEVLPQLISEIPEKLEELDVKIGELQNAAILTQSMKLLKGNEEQEKAENIKSKKSKKNALEDESDDNIEKSKYITLSSAAIPNATIRDIKVIKNELQGRFFELSRSMGSLMQINKNLVELIKNNDEK
jgi:hypothetical protein